MVNILIIGKNMTYCKDLINYINIENANLKICGIATNYKELQSILLNHYIDIIIKITKPSVNNSIKFEKMLNKKEFTKSIILIIDSKYIPDSIKSNNLIYNYFSKTEKLEKIIESINNLILFKMIDKNAHNSIENIIKDKIRKELKYLSFNLTHNGTLYIIEAIYLLYTSKNYYNNRNLEKEIYPILAKKYNKTANTIKCDIINATTTMYYDCDANKLKRYLNEFELAKPGPKKIISAVLYKIA